MGRTAKSNYNPLSFLNVFKIFAAFGVFLIHYNFEGLTISNNCPFLSFLKSGLEPVAVFFVISGVLFFFAYYTKIKNDQLKFKDFFLKRIIRLWPLLIIMVVCNYIFFLAYYFSGHGVIPGTSISAIEFFVAIFFASPVLFNGNNSLMGVPSWYITVLMFCYLIAFLLTKLDKKVKNKLVFLLPLILGGLMLVLEINYPFFNVYEGRGLFAFFLGFYVGYALSGFAKLNSKNKLIVRLLALILPIFYVVIFYFPDLRELIFPYHRITAPLAFTSPLFFVFYDLKWANKASAIKPFKYLSNISYDFYMLHGTPLGPMMLLGASLLNRWYILLSCVMAGLALAAISNYFIGHKLTNYLNKKLGYEH